jgi:sigma-E factor negative regulatory protein RseB
MRAAAAKIALAAIMFGMTQSLSAVAADGATGWLERMSAAMSQMTYQGTFVYVQGDQVETMRVTHVADESGVRERLFSVSGEQREIVRDSSGIRWVQGDEHSVMEDPVSGRTFFPEISIDLSDTDPSVYRFRMGDTERIAGHNGRQVRIVPLDQYRYGYTLWLEEQSALLLKWELTDSKQKRLAKLMFTDLRLGSEVDIDELRSENSWQEYRKLESRLPSGGNLTHSNPKWQAARLPPGFRLTSHRYLGKSDQDLYEHLVYSDGLAAVSVYVESTDEDTPDQKASMSRMGTAHAYSRVSDGVTITVVGDVPAVTVMTIGDAVRPKQR